MRSPAGGEIGEAPPVADEASRFRGSAPIGGHDSARESVGTTVGKRAPPLRTARYASVGADAYIGPHTALPVTLRRAGCPHPAADTPPYPRQGTWALPYKVLRYRARADRVVRPYKEFRRGRCLHRPALPHPFQKSLSLRTSDRFTGVAIRIPRPQNHCAFHFPLFPQIPLPSPQFTLFSYFSCCKILPHPL